MYLNQGDIVLVPYPFSDLTETKKRPAIVISNSKINKSHDVILAAITSTVYNDDFTFRIIDSIVTTPLRLHCEIRCDTLFTADKSIIIAKISALKKNIYPNVLKQIEKGIEIL